MQRLASGNDQIKAQVKGSREKAIALLINGRNLESDEYNLLQRIAFGTRLPDADEVAAIDAIEGART